MAVENEDPEMAADRLEAALERIARAAEREGVADGLAAWQEGGAVLAARLDSLIARLRAVLGQE